MTCNQNLVIANVAARDRGKIDKLVEKYGLDGYKQQSGIRRHSIACVALPTCRSEEHTSELQSLMRISYAVFCLKKKKTTVNCCNTRHSQQQYITFNLQDTLQTITIHPKPIT